MKVIYKGPLGHFKDKVFDINWRPGVEQPPWALTLWQDERRQGKAEAKDLMAPRKVLRPRRPGDLVMIDRAPQTADHHWQELQTAYGGKLLKLTHYGEGSTLAQVELPSGHSALVSKSMLTYPLDLCPLLLPQIMSPVNPLSEQPGRESYIGRAWLFEITTSEPLYKVQTQGHNEDLFWYAYQRHLTEVILDDVAPDNLLPGDLVVVRSSCSLHLYVNRVVEVVSIDERPIVRIRVRRNSNSEDDLFLRPTSIKKVIVKDPEAPLESTPLPPEKFFYEEITTPWWYAVRSNKILSRSDHPKQLADGTYLVIVAPEAAPRLKNIIERIQLVEAFKDKTIQGISFRQDPFELALALEGRWNKNIMNFVEAFNLKKVWYGPLEETNERMNFYWKGKVVLRKKQLSKDFINQLLRRCPYEACK